VELITGFIDLVLHLDVHLQALVANYGEWVYLILFAIIFCETGLVVTPFLPGDSLLFVAGALAGAGGMDVHTLFAVLALASFSGDNTNYWLGRFVGPRLFNRASSRLLNPAHLERTQRFYEKHGWRDRGGFDYPAETRDGTLSVPCRRYEKPVARGRQGA